MGAILTHVILGPTRRTIALVLAMLFVPVAAVVSTSLFVSRPGAATPSVSPLASVASLGAPLDAKAPEEADRSPEIRGRILDAEGNPAAGANVRLVSHAPPYEVLGDTKRPTFRASFSFAHVPRLACVSSLITIRAASSAARELRPAERRTTELDARPVAHERRLGNHRRPRRAPCGERDGRRRRAPLGRPRRVER